MNRIKLLASLLFLGAFGHLAYAQPTNVEAKEILNKASEKLKSYKVIEIKFDYDFENPRVDPPIKQHETGVIAVQGEDYHLVFMGMEQIRSGNMLYTILKEDEEVQVTEYDEEENSGLTPSSILKSFQKGYSYKLGGKEVKDGKTIEYVILRPVASEEIDKIMVGVEKGTNQLVSLKQWGTNGTITTFLITSFEPNKSLPAGYFKFDKSKYPGYYIAD